MSSLECYKIDLKGLTEAETAFEWDVDDAFFSTLDTTEVQQGSLHVSGSIRKASGFFELLFHVSGTVSIACDRCLDLMDQPIEADNSLVVKFGSGNPSEDDVIVVDENEGILDCSWLVYETIALAIPTRHVHEEGACNKEMLERIRQLTRQEENSEEQAVDPRWSKLEKLKSTIKE